MDNNSSKEFFNAVSNTSHTIKEFAEEIHEVLIRTAESGDKIGESLKNASQIVSDAIQFLNNQE